MVAEDGVKKEQEMMGWDVEEARRGSEARSGRQRGKEGSIGWWWVEKRGFRFWLLGLE